MLHAADWAREHRNGFARFALGKLLHDNALQRIWIVRMSGQWHECDVIDFVQGTIARLGKALDQLGTPQFGSGTGNEALISEPAVETFDVSVLNWFAGLNVDQFNMLLDTPGEEMARGKFAAIIHSNPFWPAAFGDDTVERPRDASTGQTSIHF